MAKRINGLTRQQFQKVYDRVLKQGLSNGVCDVSDRNVCIEAAVCIATGDTPIEQFELLVKGDDDLEDGKFSDSPSCVANEVASLKIGLNDSGPWETPAQRAKALYDIGVAQLGTEKLKNFDRRFQVKLEELVERMNARYRAALIAKSKLKKSYTLAELLEAYPENPVHELAEELDGDYMDTAICYHDTEDFLQDRLPDWAKTVKQTKPVEWFIAEVITILRQLKSPGVVWMDAIKREQGLAAKRRKAKKKTKR